MRTTIHSVVFKGENLELESELCKSTEIVSRFILILALKFLWYYLKYTIIAFMKCKNKKGKVKFSISDDSELPDGIWLCELISNLEGTLTYTIVMDEVEEAA